MIGLNCARSILKGGEKRGCLPGNAIPRLLFSEVSGESLTQPVAGNK